MCIRAYLMGDGVGKDTHLSVFFVVMQSEYDSVLVWPLMRKVSLILMSQSSGKDWANHFFSDPDSDCFKRPKTNMNLATGCPLFVPHTMLESTDSGYLKDDTIYIKCVVE